MNNEEWCKKNCPYYPDCSGGGACNYVLSLLKEQEPKTGHWIVLENCSNAGVYCSECNTKIFDNYPMKKKLSQFCGHCGAKMERMVKLE